MKSTFYHTNINVLDIDKSVAFYNEALGFNEERRKVAPDGSFVIVFLGDGTTEYKLELTWLRDKKAPYNLGDNEWHLAVRVSDPEAARAKHEEMGCICYENKKMGLYFISDPDGYWIEILK